MKSVAMAVLLACAGCERLALPDARFVLPLKHGTVVNLESECLRICDEADFVAVTLARWDEGALHCGCRLHRSVVFEGGEE